MQLVRFDTDPARYRHWQLDVRGEIATLAMNVSEDGGLVPGYSLKLNSYDLGVDIELADAIQRIRFSHPAVRALVLTSLRDRMFCAGANIFMLGQSTHAVQGELLQVHQRDPPLSRRALRKLRTCARSAR